MSCFLAPCQQPGQMEQEYPEALSTLSHSLSFPHILDFYVGVLAPI